MAMAADRCYMSCEQIIPTEDFRKHGSHHTQRISRLMTTGVVERRGAAHFTECPPDYGRDEAFQKEYAATAKSDEAWDAFRAKYLDVPEEDYQRLVGVAS
jgi:glutaconate CoA-transferase subunit A